MGVILLATAVSAPISGQTSSGSQQSQAPIAHPPVEPIVSMRDRNTTASTQPQRKRSYSLSLTGTDWTDTGVTVVAGETADFTSTGSYALGDGRSSSPDGLDRGWRDMLRVFPLNSAKVGEVVGRVSDVGASVPFSVGAKNQVTFPTSGRLFLRVNLSSDLSGNGTYKVQVKFAAASKTPQTTPQAASAPVSGVVSPETFADIPRRVVDQTHHEGDMVNYALLGSEEQVRAAFKAAGWVAVDKTVEDAVLHGLLSTLNHEAYTEMPMSTLYLFGRPQDLSFARGDPLMVAAERHHLRVWQTDKSVGGLPLWVGSATHDIGFEKDQRNGNVTHKIDPKIDDERDYLLQSFDATGGFSSAAYVTPADPLTTARTATGGSFYSDGRILVMELK
ncbi:LssY C-terminal domain-containing protein [Granulicella sp. dw_53]|uniref:LssY C-terminal domain-containing protein n=1 Tax=Granulicella sp. dw_53 TaxID=2719792 RepID=UPI001BD68825|nr:LssY C-terminal domain-containing protein [Granulicella sp. dw_53]